MAAALIQLMATEQHVDVCGLDINDRRSSRSTDIGRNNTTSCAYGRHRREMQMLAMSLYIHVEMTTSDDFGIRTRRRHLHREVTAASTGRGDEATWMVEDQLAGGRVS